MGLRFYRRVHLAPGLALNFSRSGPSLTMGVRGAHVTVGRHRVTRTVGLPGTGLFYTSRSGYHSGYHSAVSDRPMTPTEQTASAQHVERTLLVVVVIGIALVVLARAA